MKMKSISLAVAMGLVWSMTAFSDPITVTLIGTGVSDGAEDVLPYILNIGLADCYDINTPSSIGESWLANELTLSEAESSGRFSGQPNGPEIYRKIGALSFEKADTTQEQIDLNHTIWNLTAPGRFAITAGMTADLEAAIAAIPTTNFDDIRYVEPIKGVVAQTFVVHTPEPLSLALCGSGLMLLGLWRRRRPSLASCKAKG